MDINWERGEEGWVLSRTAEDEMRGVIIRDTIVAGFERGVPIFPFLLSL
jgi:hypothetical protein